MTDTRALVLFSGGQDSATCLAWALGRFGTVETVGFDYGQRHAVELECRGALLERLPGLRLAWARRIGADHRINLRHLATLADSALTSDRAIEVPEQGLPTSFVPGRNLLFFTYAAILAARRGLRHLVGGMCETDYSGYPDCRDDTLKALQVVLNLGMDQRFVLHAPLMWRDKAETWRMAESLGGPELVELLIEHSHSCYQGDRSQRHPWGYGCGHCPACELRARGWERYRAKTS
jgi:7-cyano-7-deazaguanine synthase